jgi:uncharacterized protein (TIGR02453 family)
MSHFTKEFTKFFEELKQNNNREWFTANKKRYEKHVKRPFEAFVSVLIVKMQEYDPQCTIQPKDAIFRIYRDIRFSKDKTPYKTNVSAVIGRGGRKEKTLVGMYVELSADHIRIYGGVYMPDKEQLYSIRQEILYNQKEFERLISDKTFVKYFGEVRGDKNIRLPPEFAEIQDEQPLIANKQFYYYSEIDPKLITDDGLIEALFTRFEAGADLRKFLLAPLTD